MDDRRQFLAKLLGGAAAAALILKSRPVLAKKLGLSLDKVEALKKVGGSATVKLDGKELLLIRDTETTVRALSSKCTHQNCLVSYNPSAKKVECKCHGSAFDVTGKVLKGPATTALPCYLASLSDGRIILTVE
jgi:Rieske Fe-S protein